MIHVCDTSHSRMYDMTYSHICELQVLGKFGMLLATFM